MISPENLLDAMRKMTGEHPYREKDPFKILIATVISQRTRDEVTYTVAEKLFCEYGAPEKLMRASVERVAELIKPAGFYREKAKRIVDMSRILCERFDCRVPDTMAALLLLPGVGRKTANIVLSRAFGVPAIAVDVHVHRISNRLGIVNTSTPDETEQALMDFFPKECWHDVNSLFVMFGRGICRPLHPRCESCILKEGCRFYQSNASSRSLSESR